MTLVIELPPDVEQAAREMAAEKGESLERWALDALRRATRDPLDELLENAPEDDEPYTEEQQQADLHAWDAYKRGSRVSHADVVAQSRAREEAA